MSLPSAAYAARKDEAAAVAQRRRPSVAAWALNQAAGEVLGPRAAAQQTALLGTLRAVPDLEPDGVRRRRGEGSSGSGTS